MAKKDTTPGYDAIRRSLSLSERTLVISLILIVINRFLFHQTDELPWTKLVLIALMTLSTLGTIASALFFAIQSYCLYRFFEQRENTSKKGTEFELEPDERARFQRLNVTRVAILSPVSIAGFAFLYSGASLSDDLYILLGILLMAIGFSTPFGLLFLEQRRMEH